MDRDDRKDSIVAMHRQNIIAVAKELFVAKGFEKTTMDDISAQAHYSKRTIYNYFTGKEQIYSTIILVGITELMLKIHAACEIEGDFVKRYFEVCKVLSDFYDDMPTYFEGVISFQKKASEYVTESPENENVKAIFDVGEQINAKLEEFLKLGQEQGIILDHLDLKKTVIILWDTMLSIIVMAEKKSGYIKTITGSSRDEFMRFGFHLLLNSILA